MRRSVALWLVGLTVSASSLATSCGSSSSRREGATPKTMAGARPTAAAAPASTASSNRPVGDAGAPLARGHLRRADVVAVLSRGLPAFLSTLEVAPKLVAGRFAGWRIVRLGPTSFWRGVDLAPGDVVLDVNGRSIERPEEALSVWQSLVVAPTLRVALDRAGERKTLAYIIDE